MGTEEKKEFGSGDKYVIPILPLPGKVLFPNTSTPLNVVRGGGVLAVKYAINTNRVVLLLNQRKDTDEPSPEDFHPVGTISEIADYYDPGDGSIRIAVEGKKRAVVIETFKESDLLFAEVRIPFEDLVTSRQSISLMRQTLSLFEKYVRKDKEASNEVLVIARRQEDIGKLADFVAHKTAMHSDRKQIVLDEIDPIKRLQIVHQLLKEEIELSELDRDIEKSVKESIQRTHKEFYLQEKLKEINKQLGRGEEIPEVDSLREQIHGAGMPEEAQEKAEKELKRLRQMPGMSAEAGVIRTYIDWLLALPWNTRSPSEIKMSEAAKILDEDHYGLDKPKERILEYLAVMKLVERLKGPILCLVGPPGVGKTSLGKSIARATGRNFIRMSLGGVRDEAEIRGHRRTYIGSMPGRIIQGIRDSKSRNPLFLLDEIDKMSSDFRGDPASALLEVLDPEQNSTFRDHYLDTPFDLSEVMFITTANTKISIPAPLLDRMEVIELPGYTEYEKEKIAKHFLIPKQIEAHGLKKKSIEFSDPAVNSIITKYTREAGVRNLEREITKVCRKFARKIADQESSDKDDQGFDHFELDTANLDIYLGPPKFIRRKAEEKDQIGVATGMVYTQVGGDIIVIEATTMRGDGGLTLTGQLGEIMKESAQTALAYIKSRSQNLDLPTDFQFNKNDIHIHVPEGAVPKEGPSAGITLATAIISALTGQEIRKDVAMTGEITLRGRVLQIGGLKEKILAAHRNQIENIIIPIDNDKDLIEIPEDVRNSLQFHKVENMTQVIELALKKNDASGQISPTQSNSQASDRC